MSAESRAIQRVQRQQREGAAIYQAYQDRGARRAAAAKKHTVVEGKVTAAKND